MNTCVRSIELSDDLTDLTDLSGYAEVLVLVKQQGYPVGCVRLDCAEGWVPLSRLKETIGSDPVIGSNLAQRGLRRWFELPEEVGSEPLPSWSVIVCTRNRPEHLSRCLASIVRLAASDGEIIVVENAPTVDCTARVVAQFPQVRYLVEPIPGVNWARKCGAEGARGEVLLYTDDDVEVDQGWIDGLRRPFRDRRVAIVTGLVMPAVLDTPSQEIFERYYSFSRGFTRREFSLANLMPVDTHPLGVGANMALRREPVVRLGLFGPELGPGTPAGAGEESYAFYRLLCLGYRAVYTPEALAWHHHRPGSADLTRTLHSYNTGFLSMLLRCIFKDGDGQALTMLGWMLRHRLWHSLKPFGSRPSHAPPLGLALVEARGTLAAPWAYWRSRRRERRLAATSSAIKPSEGA